MTLTPAWLDELRARTTLSALIGRTVKIQRAGREWKACCPFHNEKTPSFTINDEKGFYHCLAAETLVLTSHGRKPIGELAGQTAQILSRGGRWVDAEFACYGRQRLWAIHLSRNGVTKTLHATDGHRWFTRGRRTAVTTRELRPGHRLEAALPAPRTDWTLDPAGVRHGILLGDGTEYRGGYGTINLHGEKDAALADWFPDQIHNAKTRGNGAPYLRIYGGKAFAGAKSLPTFSHSGAYLLGFLAGYLAADGHVSKDGTVMLNSARADHLEQVRDIATRLGIVTYGRTTQQRRGIDGRMSELHRIHFVPASLDPALILLPEARARFTASRKRFARLRWTVIKVEETDRVEPVYCASVPESHAFALDDHILTGNCFGCGAHGDAIRWMTDQRGLAFMDAVKELAEAAGMDVPAPDRRSAERAEKAKGLHEACADAAAWYAEQLHGLAGAEARGVLDRRGIKPETARAFGMGFAPDSRRGVREALKDYGDPMLVEAGLLIQVDGKEPYDRFRGRLMIPIRDPRGRVIAFGGRIIGEGEPKYLNSPETPLFDKGRQLFNLDRASAAARKAGRIIAVEGYMDVIALAQAGFGEAVAPLGTAMTEHQLERLWRISDVPILCFDGDSAGQKAAIRAAHRALPLLGPGRSLRFVTLPQGQDPDDLVRASGPAAFEALLGKTQPLVDRLWAHELAAEPLDTPEQRAGLKRRLADLAGSIADPVVKGEYLAEFRRRCDVQFAPPPRAPFTPGRPARGRDGRTRWQPPEPPPSSTVRALSSGGIDRVLAKAVLAGLIRHPAEIARHVEVLASLRLADGALGRLFEAVIDVALEDHALDSARLRTILARSGFDQMATELLRADSLPFSFTRVIGGEADEPAMRTQFEQERRRAVADLDEAIAILAAGPRIEAALAEATERARNNGDAAAFERQVELVRESHALKARLANLMLSDKDG